MSWTEIIGMAWVGFLIGILIAQYLNGLKWRIWK